MFGVFLNLVLFNEKDIAQLEGPMKNHAVLDSATLRQTHQKENGLGYYFCGLTFC